MELRQQFTGGTRIPRHTHTEPYAAIVLQGSYCEAGDSGRWWSQAGDVLIHRPFSSHFDCFAKNRAQVLNLPLPLEIGIAATHCRIADPDLLVRTAERDPHEASQLLLAQLLPGSAASDDPVDRFAAQLASPDAPSVSDWSRQTGIRRETLFRQFRAAYDTSPTEYRVESRTKLAWKEIVTGTRPLAEIAADFGFADQAHMSRAIRKLTGLPPGRWRTQHSFNTPDGQAIKLTA